MPRKPRELVNNGIYHVYNRGNNKHQLFYECKDYRVFLKYLMKAKNAFDLEIYHYCLMNNHFHILLKIMRSSDLSQIMHKVQLAYAKYFTAKYNFVGHVFQERFRSLRIPNDSYYLQCGRYIELNPVKAKIVSKAEQYPWSSAKYYTLGVADPLVNPNIYYMELGKSSISRCKEYRKFLSYHDPYERLIDEFIPKQP